MLTIADDLSSFALAAGEPFLLDVQFKNADGSVADVSARAFVLSFYRGDRTTFQAIAPVTQSDESGQFIRFVREGTFSEELLGQSLTVELAERLRNGREIIA